MSSAYWLPAIVGGLVAAVSPLMLRPFLRRIALFDVPNERSSHDRPTLRAAGIAQLLGIMAAALTLFTAAGPPAVTPTSAVILGAAAAAGLLGLWDDSLRGRGLGVAVRAGLQLLIGGVTAAWLAGLAGAPWWAAAVATLFVAAYINMVNFMDGINGISALHGLVAGATQFAIGVAANLPWLQALGLIIAAAYLVFLPWNVLGAGMFLGDVGSYLLGAAVGAGVVGAVFSGVPVVVAVSPTAIYLADTLATLARRAARGEPVLRAHRTHAYQRLTVTGLSHLQVSLLVAVFSAGTAASGLLALVLGLDSVLAAVLILVLCALYLALPRLRGDRLPPPPLLTLKEIELPRTVLPRAGFQPTRWVVLGASGFVGSALAEALELRGFEVVRLSAPRLSLSPTDDAHEVVAQARGSNDLGPLSAVLRGADVVVNAAGLATPDAPADDSLYGANALLPALLATAACDAGVTRVIHLSSAAVQGRRPRLDETLSASPFSSYSHSKALGERAFLAAVPAEPDPDLLVVRATSVQGPGRRTTESFRRIAQSPLASVAAPGTQPTVVSSIDGLVDFVLRVGTSPEPLGPVLLQPWEGYSVQEVLRAAGGQPRTLPRWLCLSLLTCARVVGRVVPEVAGAGRRLEMMWLGQGQDSAHGVVFPAVSRQCLVAVLGSPHSGASGSTEREGR